MVFINMIYSSLPPLPPLPPPLPPSLPDPSGPAPPGPAPSPDPVTFGLVGRTIGSQPSLR